MYIRCFFGFHKWAKEVYSCGAKGEVRTCTRCGYRTFLIKAYIKSEIKFED